MCNGITISEKEITKHITEDNLFIRYEDAIIQGHIEEYKRVVFKGKFKEILNSKIKKTFEGTKDEETFKKIFPNFYKWVTEIAGQLTTEK